MGARGQVNFSVGYAVGIGVVGIGAGSGLVAVVGEIVVVGLADAEVGPVDIVDL